MAILQGALQVATFAGVGSCARRRCFGRAHAVTTHQTPSASAISSSVCMSAVMTPALRVSRALLPARSVIRSQCPNNRLRYFTFALPFHVRHMANESLHIHSTAPTCADVSIYTILHLRVFSSSITRPPTPQSTRACSVGGLKKGSGFEVSFDRIKRFSPHPRFVIPHLAGLVFIVAD